ncbi:MAG: NADH-quinone oxidoreductase subunit C [Chitinophagaceae bacterium]
MTNEEIKLKVTELLPAVVVEAGGEWINVLIEPSEWKPFALQLRYADGLLFDFLFCVTCVDWKTHLTMVYHLSSTAFRHNLVVKIKLDRNEPRVETVADIWRTAEFNEREAYEMFGVHFINHPDLRLLILPDGWEGRNPMRKDFEDAVNMIKL